MSAPARVDLERLGLSATCTEVLRHLWDYLDDEVTPASADRLKAHIASCTQCAGYEGFQSCFLDGLARLKQSLACPNTVREKLAAKLREEGCGCWERARGS